MGSPFRSPNLFQDQPLLTKDSVLAKNQLDTEDTIGFVFSDKSVKKQVHAH